MKNIQVVELNLKAKQVLPQGLPGAQLVTWV